MFRKLIKLLLTPLKLWLLADTRTLAINNHLLTGRLASWHVRSLTSISSLQDVEFKVSSQWGEDGIIDWLVERAGIPPQSRTFVEFGVEDYRESNTRFLLQNRHWRGLILDGGVEVLKAARNDGLCWAHDLTVRSAFITRENINGLIRDTGFRGDIGLLSIDIDGNDYWVWEAIQIVQPIICVCEYNAVFGDIHPVSVPYNPTFDRTSAHHSNLYFGASIMALRSLARKKGYCFVGTTTAANDAFFVREDYAQKFLESSLQNIRAFPSFIREAKDKNGQLMYLGGLERLKYISSLPVVNVETGAIVRLGDLDTVYSGEWLAMMINS